MVLGDLLLLVLLLYDGVMMIMLDLLDVFDMFVVVYVVDFEDVEDFVGVLGEMLCIVFDCLMLCDVVGVVIVCYLDIGCVYVEVV